MFWFVEGLSLPTLVISPLQLGLGARWEAYPGDQATWVGIVNVVVALVFIYLGVRVKNRTYKAGRRIGGTAGAIVFVTFAMSAVSVYFFFYTLQRTGGLVPSPVSPVTYGTAGILFVVIAILASLRNKGRLKVALLSAFVGPVVGVMVFELPYLFIISPQMGFSVDRALLSFTPLFCLCFASFSLLFLTPLTRISRYTFFSLAALFIGFALWAFLADFGFPSNPTAFFLNALAKVLSYVVAFTLFMYKDDSPRPETAGLAGKPGAG